MQWFSLSSQAEPSEQYLRAMTHQVDIKELEPTAESPYAAFT